MEGRTRVSYQRNPGFLDRVGSSLVAILVGLAILLISSGLLFWNEGRAVQTARSLDEGLEMAVSLPNPQVVSMENNGKLVHLIGPLSTDKILSDPLYNVAVHAVKLKRSVEMYQWVEHETERKYDEGNGQTRVEKSYSYTQEWRSDLIRSSSFDNAFHYRNPAEMAVQAKTFQAESVHVGGFLLSSGLVSQISDFRPLIPDPSLRLSDPNVQLFDGYFYHGLDPTRPQVGDIRVKLSYAGISGVSKISEPTTVSIIARQLGQKLLSYQTLAGDQLEILYTGSMSKQEIFNKQKMQNTFLTWAIRFGGWLLMFIGFSCLTSIITTIVDWIPLIRDVVALSVCLMNMSLSISLSLTIIAVAWIWYRPLLGMAILAMSLTPYIMTRMTGAQRTSRWVD